MRIVQLRFPPRALTLVLLAVVMLSAPGARALPNPGGAVQNGCAFLTSLFDADMGLLPEYRGARVYWLFHDNYLAAKVLAGSHPDLAKKITTAIQHEGIHRSGKIELIFGEAERPLPFREYELLDVRRAGNKVIRTEKVSDRVFAGWENYADLLLLAGIAETNPPAARQHWEAAMRMWDGKGFMDAAARSGHQYATYKLGLALLASGRLSPPAMPPQELVDRLLAMQDESGGWITDYDATGKRIGLANVETTCLVILGLEAFAEAKPASTK